MNIIKSLILSATLVISLVTGSSAHAQLLYKVEGNNISQPSYIFGTHHLVPLSFLDSVNGLHEALDSVNVVVGEIDMTGNSMAMAMAMQPYMTAPQDSTLSKLFTPREFVELNKKFEDLNVLPGVNLYALETLKPMAVINLVTISLFRETMPDFDPENQIDAYLQRAALNDNKHVVGLETPERQAELLFNFKPLTVQAESLAKLLEHPEKISQNAREMNKAYLAQDPEALFQLSFKDEDDMEDAAFVEALLDKRNKDWTTKLIELMDETPVLLVCGALHLPGDNGVISMLRNAGYTITPIK